MLILALIIQSPAWAENVRPSTPESVHKPVIDAIREKVMTAAQAQYPDAEIHVEVPSLNPRLQLPACSALHVEPRGNRLYGRVPVAVSCSAPQQWSIFQTATVSAEQQVVVTRGPLARGQRLSGEQLTTEFRDLSRLRDLHYTRVDDLVGMELKRPLAAGSVLYTTMLRTPLAIRRGDKVAIVATRGSVRISVPGESLENGKTGEQIKVRNRQSDKVVHVWVTGIGTVSTSAPRFGDVAANGR